MLNFHLLISCPPPLVISLSRLFLPHLFHIFSPFPVALVIPLFQVRDSSSHLESVPAVGQSLALPGAREESHHGAPPHVPVLRVAFPLFQVRDSSSHLEPEMADIQ